MGWTIRGRHIADTYIHSITYDKNKYYLVVTISVELTQARPSELTNSLSLSLDRTAIINH